MRDLKRRGLVDETIVVWGSGLKGGWCLAYGSTDEFGFKGVANRESIHDLHAKMLYARGIDHTKLTMSVWLTDMCGEVVKGVLV